MQALRGDQEMDLDRRRENIAAHGCSRYPFMKGALPQVYLGQIILKPPAGKSQNKKYGTGFP
jgi:hypothetical protein